MSSRRIILIGLLSVSGVVGCARNPADALGGNIQLQLRCSIEVHGDEHWARNRNLVVIKKRRSSYNYVFGNPWEFHSKKYTDCPASKATMRGLITETKSFLDQNGKDVRATEAEDAKKFQLWLEDMKDGILDNKELEPPPAAGPIHWTLSLSYGSVEEVPAADNWGGGRRLKHELEYEVYVNDRSEFPSAFTAILSKYQAIFPEVQSMDRLDQETTRKNSEVPQLIHIAE